MKIVLAFGLFGTLMNPVFAKDSGRETGNGGFAHVCRDADGKITSARLLDLWEGEALGTWSSSDAKERQIELIYDKVENLSPAFLSRMKYVMDQVLADAVFTDRKLSKTEDAFPPYEPGLGCNYEQVARFETMLTETGKPGLRINREIYHSPLFSETDRAALYIHEAIYWLERGLENIRNSSRSRVIVAHLFSDSRVTNEIRLLMVSMINHTHHALNYAVNDPTKFLIRFGLDHWDGIDKAPGSSKMKYRYRCEVRGGGSDVLSSNWLTEKEINEIQSKAYGSLIEGEIQAGSFTIPEFPFDSVSAQCFKKSPKGKVSPFSFIGFVHIPDSSLLIRHPDGSIQSMNGNRYSFQIDGRGPDFQNENSGLKLQKKGVATQWINFVRAVLEP